MLPGGTCLPAPCGPIGLTPAKDADFYAAYPWCPPDTCSADETPPPPNPRRLATRLSGLDRVTQVDGDALDKADSPSTGYPAATNKSMAAPPPHQR